MLTYFKKNKARIPSSKQRAKQVFGSTLGFASVEFILIISAIYVPMVLGTVDVARGFYHYNTITKSVRNAVRYLSLVPAGASGYDTKVNEAKCLVVYGNVACTGAAQVSGLTTSYVTVTGPIDASSGGVNIKLITVEVSGFNLSYITSFFAKGASQSFGTIKATMRQATQ